MWGWGGLLFFLFFKFLNFFRELGGGEERRGESVVRRMREVGGGLGGLVR